MNARMPARRRPALFVALPAGLRSGLLWAMVLLAACSEDEDAGQIEIRFEHTVDQKPLSLNDEEYTNAAGNRYSLTRLEYILTEVALVRSNGTTYRLRDVHYVNIAESASLEFAAHRIPGGDYRGIAFRFGVSASTAFGDLPNEVSLNNMAWPIPLGGGYHYMRLEGLVEDGAEPLLTHLGPSGGQDYSFVVELPLAIDVGDAHNTRIVVRMDLSQWWEAPHIYDFTGRGRIMGAPDVQALLQANGTTVFSARLLPELP